MTSIFDQFMQPFFSPMRSFWSELERQQPSIDLQDRGDHFSLTAQLPGYSKDDVEVRIDSTGFELKAERRAESKGKTKNGEQSQQTYSYFHRYFTLPEQVVAEKVEGTMKNGILELNLPKRQKLGGSSRRVDLK